jgi:hypothetical protein
MDRGALAAFRFENGSDPVVFINLFAANDPSSSLILIKKILDSSSFDGFNSGCLLSLRDDRGARSLQWKEFLNGEGKGIFKKQFFTGNHGRILKRNIADSYFINSSDPSKINSFVMERCSGPFVIFGLANIVGTGLELIEYWKANGRILKSKEIDL